MPSDTNASFKDFAICEAPLVSLCMQILSASKGNRVPSIVSTVPSLIILKLRSITSDISDITDPSTAVSYTHLTLPTTP